MWQRLRRKLFKTLSPRFKRGLRGVLIALLVATALIISAYLWVQHHYANQWAVFAQKSEPPWAITPQRLIPLLDAVSAGIAAFVLFGIFTFLGSLGRPEEETVDDRISYLYSARQRGTAKASQYLKEQVTLLGAMVSRAEMTFTLQDLSSDKKYLRTYVKTKMHLWNTMELDTYQQKMPLKVNIDPIADLIPTLGFVYEVTTCPCDRTGSYGKCKSHLDTVFALTNEKNAFHQEIQLEIPAGGSTTYEYSWDGWSLVDDVNFCGANRFIEHLVLKICNKTGETFIISAPEKPLRNCVTIKDERKLPPGECLELDFEDLPPTSDVVFRIKIC